MGSLSQESREQGAGSRAARRRLSGDRHDQLCILKNHCGCHVESELEEREKSGEKSEVVSAPSTLG